MESPPISTLTSISPSWQSALRQANIYTVADLILAAPSDLAKCRISVYDAQLMVDAVCQELAVHPCPLDDASHAVSEIFTTGDEALDVALGGGIRTKMIWEIVGESAAGKTQLSLQLSLFAQLPRELRGLYGTVCFLSTSWTLPTARILEMLDSHPQLSPELCGLSHIHTLKTTTIPMLLHVLSHTLPDFVEAQLRDPQLKPTKLIVVDALTELFHSASKTTSDTLAQRAKAIADISCLLHSLAHKYNLAVVVLNEVADAFDRSTDLGIADKGEVLYRDQARWFSRAHTIPGESKKEATLGLSWANQVNARVMLTRTERMRYLDDVDIHHSSKRRRVEGSTSVPQAATGDLQPVRLRRLTVIFNAVGPLSSVDYIVNERGIVVIKDDDSLSGAAAAPLLDNSSCGSRREQGEVVDAFTSFKPPEGEIVLSSQSSEQVLAFGHVQNQDVVIASRLDEVEAEEGPQADVDDWESYWNDPDLDDLYNTLDLDS